MTQESVGRKEENAVGTPRVRPLSEGAPSIRAERAAPPSQLWRALDASGDPNAAVALIVGQLDSPSEIVRASAAASLLAVPTETTRALSTLTGIHRSGSSTARALAALALGSVAATGAGGVRPTRASPDRVGSGAPGEISIGIASTFGRWRSPQLTPGGPLFALLKKGLSPNLYSDAKSYYRWTGEYSEVARRDAAADLERWLATSGSARRLDSVYAHSHDGSVALDAVALGVPMKFLLLIDTPALRRPAAEWAAINERLGRAVSLRSRLDLVILLDRLLHGGPGGPGSDGLSFDGAFDCRVLSPPVWFSHTALLRPSVWKRFDLVDEIRYERSLA